MAYNPELLANNAPGGSRAGVNIWTLTTDDALGAVTAADYISDASAVNMKLGDVVTVVSATFTPVDPISNANQGTNAPVVITAVAGVADYYVSAVSTTGAATLTAM